MAGLKFFGGDPDWEDLPQRLGLVVDHRGKMQGLWRGVGVSATFSRFEFMEESFGMRGGTRNKSLPLTTINARIDPPLGLEGLDQNYYFDRIVDYAFREDFRTRAQLCGFFNTVITDDTITISTRGRYESSVAVYSAVFDLLAWAVSTLVDRRAKAPPPWEIAVAQGWPALAQSWGMLLDVRRLELAGTVRGRPTTARLVNSRGVPMTCVEVAAPLPPGCTLSLTRQYEDAGFFGSLFSGIMGDGVQDIILGDPAFDAAFVVMGNYEPFVRQVLTPAARQQILGLTQAGAAITFANGKLAVWTKQYLLSQDQLAPFLKAAFSTASALGVRIAPSLAPVAPYR